MIIALRLLITFALLAASAVADVRPSTQPTPSPTPAVTQRATATPTHTPGPTPSLKSGSVSNVNNTHTSITIRNSTPPAAGGFVTVCGAALCLNGSQFKIHGGTAYGTYDNPAAEVGLAHSGNINTLELVEFDTQFHVLSDTMSEATWSRVDRFVAQASRSGLHVILNLSEYGQSLQAAGLTPTTADWSPYLSFIANRTNTVTGVQYKNDPTIAMVELFGEICFPGEVDSTCPAGTSGTAADMQSFFHRTETEWAALAPSILISSGGFSHLNGNTNIPWQAIVSDPVNKVCDLEVNSSDDVTGAVGKFTSYCKSLGKPWFLAAWSSCFGSKTYPFFTPTDVSMALHAQDMYNLAAGESPAVYPAVGADFWNLRDEGMTPGTCSLSPSFPYTWSIIRATAP